MARIGATDSFSDTSDSGTSSDSDSDSDQERREQRRRETVLGNRVGGGNSSGGSDGDTTTTGGGGGGPGSDRNIGDIQEGAQEPAPAPDTSDSPLGAGTPTGQQIEDATGGRPSGFDPDQTFGGQDLATESEDLADQGNVSAQELETRFVENNPGVTREDAVVTRRGDRLVAGLSQSAYWGRVNRAIDEPQQVSMGRLRDVQEYSQRRADERGEAFDERQRELAGEDFRDVQEFGQRRAQNRAEAAQRAGVDGGPLTTGGTTVSRELREIFGGPGDGDTQISRVGGITVVGQDDQVTALEARQGRRIEETSIEDFLGDFGAGAASEVTPHAQMTLGDTPGLRARAAREEVFAERAESGFESLMNFGLPSKAEAGALLFQTGEIAERQIGGAASGIAQASPTRGRGPSILGEQIGDVPGTAVEFIGGTIGAGVGSVTQLPTTATADITGDTLTETQELEQPPDELLGIGEVPEDTTPSTVANLIAAENPGIESGDLEVSRTGRGFDVEADLSNQDLRERVAAFNPGTDPENIWFSEEGGPMSTAISDEGQTPTEAAGGTVATGVRTAEAQIELAQEAPVTTAVLFALPAAETAGRFRTGLAEGRSGARVVRASEVTTEAGVRGEIPMSRSFERGTTREAVRDIETRAAEQPEVIQEAMGGDPTLFHTTGERLGEPIVHAEGATGVTDVITGQRYRGQRALEVGEGASELPGLFTSPEVNPVGLRSTNIAGRGTSSLSGYLRPRLPDLGGSTDRIAGLPGERVRGMPERASGQGYEVRAPETATIEGVEFQLPSERVVSRGLGRGEAKALAEYYEGAEVAPDVTTSGYEFLTQEATPGEAYVKPSAGRSAEIEAIFPPRSEFVQRTGGPRVDVQFGGRLFDVPFTNRQLSFGGERVPLDPFRRAGETAREGEARTTPAEGGARLTGEEIGARYTTFEEAALRASRRQGPASPTTTVAPTMVESSPMAPSRAPSAPSPPTEPTSIVDTSPSPRPPTSPEPTTTTAETTPTEPTLTTPTETFPTSPGPTTPTTTSITTLVPDTPTTPEPTTPTTPFIPTSDPDPAPRLLDDLEEDADKRKREAELAFEAAPVITSFYNPLTGELDETLV